MSLYMAIDLAVIAGPFLLSFDRKVAYWRKWPAVFMAVAVVGTAYIAWDVIVTEIGHWSFSYEYAGTTRLLGLPPAEILFFLVVPYACLFIYECVRAYFPERTVPFSRWYAYALSVLFSVGVVIFVDRGYTALVMGSVALFFLVAGLAFEDVLKSSHTWFFFLISYVPFMIVNGVLTALPIVSYGPDFIIGLRITSIPLEDFFYNFSLLGFNLLVHLSFRRRFVETGEQSA